MQGMLLGTFFLLPVFFLFACYSSFELILSGGVERRKACQRVDNSWVGEAIRTQVPKTNPWRLIRPRHSYTPGRGHGKEQLHMPCLSHHRFWFACYPRVSVLVVSVCVFPCARGVCMSDLVVIPGSYRNKDHGFMLESAGNVQGKGYLLLSCFVLHPEHTSLQGLGLAAVLHRCWLSLQDVKIPIKSYSRTNKFVLELPMHVLTGVVLSVILAMSTLFHPTPLLRPSIPLPLHQPGYRKQMIHTPAYQHL